jgi:hypothetical protein
LTERRRNLILDRPGAANVFNTVSQLLKSNKIVKQSLLVKQICVWLVVCAAMALQSCANSVQIVAEQTTGLKDVGVVGGGTAYVSVDFSKLDGIDRQDATEMSNTVATSIAQALGPSFRQARTATDVTRIEPDSADLVVLLRAQNPKYPKLWSDISRAWGRVLLIGALAELYNVVALDFPARRNDAVLPLSALALSLYNFVYCYHYESTKGSYSLEYQLFILKPDGSLISQRLFADSARVLVQADAKISDLRFKDLIAATKPNVSGLVQNFVVADSASIRNLGEEMKRSYPTDCDRILTFKRNVYRVLDERSSQTTSGGNQ